MRHHISFAIFYGAAFALFIGVSGCKKHSSNDNSNSNSNTNTNTTGKYTFGWSGTDDPSKTPVGFNARVLAAAAPLPSKVDLTPYLPPIGDQGQYGTCVAWATAYYTKSASEAIAFNYTQSQLQQTSYQLSPKYLFLSIPDNQKTADCDGTDFGPALQALLTNGVATLYTVPYTDMENCSSTQIQQSWNSDAASHTIQYYRSVNPTVQDIKSQLAGNNPVIIGIQVSQDFYGWQGSGVLSTASSYLPNAYHALTIVGYDDSKGSGGAFRIANSWTTQWGDNGFIWIDYNTLVNQYLYNNNVYYIVTGGSGNNNNPPTPPPSPNPSPTPNTVDLAAWVFSDVSAYSTTGNADARTLYFNIYNVGQNPVPPSNWQFYYMYYNAYNANDYGVIFHDGLNTTVAANTYSCPAANTCNFNYTIPAGSSFTQVAFGSSSINRGYTVPALNGYYYLVLIVDPNDVLNDVNRQNNIFYATGQVPKLFQNGYSDNYVPGPSEGSDATGRKFQPDGKLLRLSGHNSAVGENTRNAYTPGEILSFVKAKYVNGEIRRKMQGVSGAKGWGYGH